MPTKRRVLSEITSQSSTKKKYWETWKTNWGKWGPNDEKGALNFVTPKVTLACLNLVREGKIYNLAIPVQKRTVIFPGHYPIEHHMIFGPSDFSVRHAYYGDPDAGLITDWALMEMHSYTHCDGLNHVWSGDKLYNKLERNKNCGIENMRGVVTRGILLDVAAYEGVDVLPGDYEITGDILHKVAKTEGVKVNTGDVLCIRTGMGWELMEREGLVEMPLPPHPGLVLSAGKWATDREVCAVFTDCPGLDKLPYVDPGPLAVHRWLEWANGTYGGQNFNFSEISRDKAYTFCCTAAPVPIVGGSGGWLVPLAII